MRITDIMERVKAHPDYRKAGMALYHNGVVRETARDGRPVRGLRVSVDAERLEQVLAEARRRPGIVDVQAWINADRDLAVGDDVMFLAVAGDIRENVIAALHETLNIIKSTVTSKTEYFS